MKSQLGVKGGHAEQGGCGLSRAHSARQTASSEPGSLLSFHLTGLACESVNLFFLMCVPLCSLTAELLLIEIM